MAAWVAVTAWFGYCAWQRFAFLQQSPFPLGIDGYFYPLQLRAILETGYMDSPAPPAAFYAMAPFALWLGPIVGAKLGAAIVTSLAVFPAYALGARLGKHPFAGLWAAAIAGGAPGAAYLATEFVKNGAGITVALWLMVATWQAAERPTFGRIAYAASIAVLALATHKVAAPLALTLTAPSLIAVARDRLRLRHAHTPRAASPWRRALFAGIASIILSILGWAAWRAWPEIAILFSTTRRWHAPALVLPRSEITMGYGALLGGVAAIAWLAHTLVSKRNQPRPDISTGVSSATAELTAGTSKMLTTNAAVTTATGPTTPNAGRVTATEAFAHHLTAALCVLALFIALPWLDATNPQGLAFRLRIMAFVPLALLCASLAGTIGGKQLAAPHRSALLAGLIAITVALSPMQPREGVVVPHPAMVEAVIALTPHVQPHQTLIVPERHIAFMVAYYTRAKTRLRFETVPFAQRVRVLTLAFIRQGSALERAIDTARTQPTSFRPPIGTHSMHRNGLVLIAEPTWQHIVAGLPEREQRRALAWPTI